MATTVISALMVISFVGLALLPETHGRFLHAEADKESAQDEGAPHAVAPATAESPRPAR
jgi:hypothetical protein